MRNEALKKIVEHVKNKKARSEEIGEIKLKTNEDFIKVVADVKWKNELLNDKLELLEKEMNIRKETV